MGYTELGKNAVSFEVSPADLEKRIGELTTKNMISRDEAKEIVIGYVQGLLAQEYEGRNAFTVMQSIGKWLLNQSEQEKLLERVFKQLAREAANNEDCAGRVLSLFKADYRDRDFKAIDKIAEHSVEINPYFAFRWSLPEKSEERKRKIIELHKDNPEHRGLVKACYESEKDQDALRELALRFMTLDHEFAWKILEEHGQPDDFRKYARALVSVLEEEDTYPTKSHSLAYQALMKIKKRTPEDEVLLRRIRTQLIEIDPRLAANVFFPWVRNRTTLEEKEKCIDREGVLELARRLLVKHGKHYNPFYALNLFKKIGHEGPEILEAGVQYFDYMAKNKVDHGKMPLDEGVREQAAIEYYKRGGDAAIVHTYIPEDIGDGLNRALAHALAIHADKNYLITRAYERAMSIKEKTADDGLLLDKLRETIASGEHESGYIFVHHSDEAGMRLFVERKLGSRDTKDTYEMALKLGDEQLLHRCRQNVVSRHWGGLKGARELFQEHADKEGITLVNIMLYDHVSDDAAKLLLGIETPAPANSTSAQ